MRRLLSLLLFAPLALAAQDTLDIYWVDVEGGAATLLVTPGGETILMDAGWSGFEDRDAKRIVGALEDAGKSKIDYFITSHFHRDHVGGLPALAERVEIGKFVDHGDSVEIGWNENADKLWTDYQAASEGKRMQVGPGDTLPLEGVDFQFVAARSRFVDQPLEPAESNPLCADLTNKDVDKGENGKSVGFIVRRGDFEFLDLGDLSWNYELELACPKNLLGEIDLYQVTHHGMDMSGAPPHVRALKPQVAVMNNGPKKGGTPEAYETLTSIPELKDLWQVHKAMHTDDSPNTDEQMIANLKGTEQCDGNWIKASVQPDGSFTVTNSRNGFSKTYQPRP